MGTTNFDNVKFKKDSDCPICLNIMVEPVQLKCVHRFCLHCIKDVFAQTELLDEKCPICRADVDYKFQTKQMVVDTTFKEYLKSQFHDEYMARKRVLRKQNLLQENKLKFNDKLKIKFVIGNSYKLIKLKDDKNKDKKVQNEHYWTVFVKLENKDLSIGKLIDKVRFHHI